MIKLVHTTLLRWWVRGYLNGLPRYRSTKMAPVWLCLLFCLTGYEGISQSEMRLGSGASVTGNQSASPVNIWYRSLNSQMLYTRAEINAAGISGALDITRFGFYIEEAPEYPLPDFTIRMKHTDSTDVSAHDPGPFTTVYTNTSYMPEEGGFDLLTLQTPFAWNGTDNILVEVCFDTTTSFSASGRVRYYATSNGFRFSRSDDTSMCGVETATTATTKPQAKMAFCCYDDETGVLAIDSPAVPFQTGNEAVQVRFKNYGANTVSGVTLHWSVNGVLQSPYNWSGTVNAGDTSNMIPIGAYNFDDKDQTYHIKVWTDNPNGNPDNFPANDTFEVSLSPGLLTADFAYRLPFTVYENADTNLTDYATLLTVNTADPIAKAKMHPEGKDIRFVQACHTNETLNYWIEGPMDDDSTKIWVNIPALPASDSLTIYMLYGNPEIDSGASNGLATFGYFDDMETWSGWTQYNGGDVVQDNARTWEGSYAAYKINNGGNSGGYKDMGQTFGRGIILEVQVNRNAAFTGGSWDKLHVIDENGDGYGVAFNHGGASSNVRTRRKDGFSGTTLDISADVSDVMDEWQMLRLAVYPNDQIRASRIRADGTEEGVVLSTDATYNTFTQFYIAGGYDFWVDAVKVRQFVEPEPTFSPGTEEVMQVQLTHDQPGDTICAADTVTFHVPGNLANYDFYVNGLLLQSGAADTFVAPSLSDGDNVRVIASGNGPCAGPVVDTVERVITVRPPLTAGFNFDVNGLMVDFTNTSVAAEMWTWDFGDTTTSAQDDPRHLYHQAGTYEVCLMASNSQCGVKDTLCQNVTVSGVLSEYFSYALPIKVYENSGNTLTDYPVAVTIDTDSLIAAGHMQPDGRDIRFTGNCMGDTVLNYWIEGPMDDESTKMWVNIPSLPASDSLTIYMLYGNPEVPPASSADKTFIRVIDSVKAAWRLDDGTGTTTADHSGNSYDGTLMNGPTWVSGQFENALDFDGTNDWVETVDFQVAEEFSVSMWLNPNSTGNGQNFLGKHLSDGSNIFLLGFYGDGYHVRIRSEATSWGTQATGWQHLAVTARQLTGTTTEVTIYQNGSLLGQATYNDVMGNITGLPWAIGQEWDGGPTAGDFFNGVIDETRMYDKVLTPDEITDLYNNYGYVTTNYAGHELVRPYMSPEPTFSLDLADEEALSAILSVTPDKAAHCEGEEITFTATEGFSDYDFLINGASVQAGPGHLYTADNLNDGDVIEVYASKPDGCVMLDSSDQVSLTIDPQPAGDYDHSVSDLTVTFNSLSTDADSLYWDFGDGQEAGDTAEPVHTYTDGGTYTVCLTAFNACGADQHCTDVEVPCNTPVADFSYTSEELTLSVTNNTQHATSWRWDFGDDIGSNEEEPVHAFTEAGTYEVCLTAMNICDTTQSCQDVNVKGVSVEELADPSEVSIYPNPAGTYVTVEINGIAASEAVELHMFGMEGREVKPATEISRSDRQVRAHITVSDLAEGFYLIRVVGESYTLNEKVFVVE